MSKWWYNEGVEETGPYQPGTLPERYTLDEIIEMLESVERIQKTSPLHQQALEYLKQYRELLALIDQWQRSAAQKWPEK